MKKFLFTFYCLVLASLALQASELVIGATLRDGNQNPVPNVNIRVELVAAGTTVGTWQEPTDDNGQIKILAQVNSALPFVIVRISYLDCQSRVRRTQRVVRQGTPEVDFNLVFCERDLVNRCDVRIRPGRTNAGLISLTAVPSGAATFTYEWSTGDTSQTILVFPNQSACVTVTDAVGCTATACFNTTQGPDCEVRIIAQQTDSSTVLIAGVNTLGVRFIWSNGQDGNRIEVTEPGEYCVEAIFPDGCIASACFTLEEEEPECIEINFVLVPNEEGDSIRIQLVYNDTLNLRFQWFNGDTTDFTIVTTTGPVGVRVFDLDNDDCFVIVQTFVTFPEPCEVEIIARVTRNGFFLIANPVRPGYEVLWSTGETSPGIFVGMDKREYCVTVTRDSTCTATACIVVPEDDGSRPFENALQHQIGWEEKLTLFPNPVHGELNVRLPSLPKEGAVLHIFHSNGTLLLSRRLDSSESGQNLLLQASDWKAGVYILQVQTQDERQNIRFIKS